MTRSPRSFLACLFIPFLILTSAPGAVATPASPVAQTAPRPLRTWNTYSLGVQLGALYAETAVFGERLQHEAIPDKDIDAYAQRLTRLAGHLSKEMAALDLSPAVTYLKQTVDDLTRNKAQRKQLMTVASEEFPKVAAFLLGTVEKAGGSHPWYALTGMHFGILDDVLTHRPVERDSLNVPLEQIAGDLKAAPADAPQELLGAMRALPKIAAKTKLDKEPELQALEMLAALAPIQAGTVEVLAHSMEPIPGLLLGNAGAIPKMAELCMQARQTGEGAQQILSPERSREIVERARGLCKDALTALKENEKSVGRWNYLFYLAYMSYDAGQYAESAKAYEQFVKADGINVPATFHNLALAYDKLGRKADAVKAIQAAAEVNSWYKETAAYGTFVTVR
jgi:tetratricopeptide (TPR) repeat protein